MIFLPKLWHIHVYDSVQDVQTWGQSVVQRGYNQSEMKEFKKKSMKILSLNFIKHIFNIVLHCIPFENIHRKS